MQVNHPMDVDNHPNIIQLDILPKDWWIWSIRQLHRNADEDLQFTLENISPVFADSFLVILCKGLGFRTGPSAGKFASGTGKSINEAFRAAVSKIDDIQT